MPASATQVLVKSLYATAALAQFQPVQVSGAPALPGGAVFGFTTLAASAGERVPIVTMGTAVAIAGGPIAAGAMVEVGATSTQVVTRAFGVAVGRALSAATQAGDQVELALTAAFGDMVSDSGAFLLTNGARPYRDRASIAATIGDVHLVANSGSTAMTRGVARVLDFEIGAVAARIYNATGGALANCKAGYAITDASDPYGINNPSAWKTLTFSAASTFTAPAGSGTIPDHTFGIIDSDFDYAATGTVGQLLHGRFYNPNATACTRFEHPTFAAPNLANSGLQGYYGLSQDGVTTPAGFSPTYHNSFAPMDFLVYPKQAIKTWVAGGASTCTGQGDSTDLGWVRRTQRLAEQAGKPISTLNMGHSGAKTLPSLQRLIQAINLVKPHYASWHPFTTNEAPALTDIPKLKGQVLQFLQACAAVGTVPVLVTFQPNNVATGDVLTVMQALNQYCREVASGGGALLLDFQLLFSGSTTGTTWLDAADTADGLHQSPQGHAKAAVLAYSRMF